MSAIEKEDVALYCISVAYNHIRRSYEHGYSIYQDPEKRKIWDWLVEEFKELHFWLTMFNVSPASNYLEFAFDLYYPKIPTFEQLSSTYTAGMYYIHRGEEYLKYSTPK